VHLIASAFPPHRQPPVAMATERLRMLQLAASEIEGFIVDDREITRGGTSYTFDTLESMRSEYPEHSLCLFMGMDAFCGFSSWHRWQEIIELSHIAVAHRPGVLPEFENELVLLLGEHLTSDVRELHENVAGRIILQEVTQLDISSSGIRDMIAQGRSPRFLLPDRVADYIDKQGVYKT